ncbi:MAG TPA: PQQ-binding-like beta-propeller repeat protein [Thermoleophilaceae bacterium]|nr:PQQ-binding-like beta-propeller repeat protein [Thermoleophilaceae bacterium]
MRARAAALALGLFLGAPATAGAYRYEVPVQASSPWPEMRHDHRNTASSPVRARYRGDRPWAFRTGKGIFSTPFIGGDGTVYVGSADTRFYALRPNGRVRWTYKTGNIIDSAGVIGAYDRRLRTNPITFGSGDEYLYHLRSDRRRMSRRARTIWRLKAPDVSVQGQIVDWWEGNAEIGPGGTIYAGNTDGTAYAVRPNGTIKWGFHAGNSVWTVAAFGEGGLSYWGSLDLNVYAVDRDGKKVWSTSTVGFVVSSPALSRDGDTLYVASFDSRLYALDAHTGAVRWFFPTSDHVYSSPALWEDPDGKVRAIVFASTDGHVYAVDADGNQLWRYYVGDPVRSSPVLGRVPNGAGRIVYVGAGNGTLYALDAATGQRRWSYDTTSRSPRLRDRNDLNASPSLGPRGVYIGSEDGNVNYVPYDYCLHRRDARCNAKPGSDFAPELARVFPVTAGGNTVQRGLRGTLDSTSLVVGRLVTRKAGETTYGAMVDVPSAASLVDPEPDFPFAAELSGDGQYLFVRPTGFLRPSTEYRVRLSGAYKTGGVHLVTGAVGATGGGTFDDTVSFRTRPRGGPLPLSVRRNRVSAFNLRRLAIPEPAFVPSVNQIGFDSYDFLVGTLARTGRTKGRVLLWVAGAKRTPRGRHVVDPARSFAFPLVGRYRGNELIMSGRDVPLTFSFGDIPVRLLEFRGQFGSGMRMRPGNFLFGEVFCPDVPTYGPLLVAIGLCNRGGKLETSGTYLTGGYRQTGAGAANRRPPGVALGSLTLERPSAGADGRAVARLRLARGARYPARSHVVGVLLVDPATGEPIVLDYRKQTASLRDGRGNLVGARLTIPAGTTLPQRVRAYAITDVFPLASRVLG